MFQLGKSGCQTRLGPCQGLCRGRNWLIMFLKIPVSVGVFNARPLVEKHNLEEVVAYKILLMQIYLNSHYFQLNVPWFHFTCRWHWMLLGSGNLSQLFFPLFKMKVSVDCSEDGWKCLSTVLFFLTLHSPHFVHLLPPAYSIYIYN